jgi:hypothetical protein
VASSVPNSTEFADRKFLSYQYNSGTGNFDIESREVTAIGQPVPPSENQFGDVLELRDVNFYFAWVSFTNPLAPVAVGINGDYNNDGSVNAADYVVWRNAGPTATLPNDPTPGVVDASDYNTWRANFGSGAGAGVGSQGVPEPASVVLVLCGAAMLGQLRVRRRTKNLM